MSQEPKKSLQIQEIIGLKPQHFADLIRTAQLVFDPCAGPKVYTQVLDSLLGKALEFPIYSQ